MGLQVSLMPVCLFSHSVFGLLIRPHGVQQSLRAPSNTGVLLSWSETLISVMWHEPTTQAKQAQDGSSSSSCLLLWPCCCIVAMQPICQSPWLVMVGHGWSLVHSQAPPSPPGTVRGC
jgi:hypothetical protein